MCVRIYESSAFEVMMIIIITQASAFSLAEASCEGWSSVPSNQEEEEGREIFYFATTS